MEDILLRRASPPRFGRRRAETGVHAMHTSDSGLFGLILLGLSVAFMLWVLWNFHKAERER
jgi:hypothetical protein